MFAPDLLAFRRWLRTKALVPGKGGMVPPVLTDAQEGAVAALGGFFRLDPGWYAAVKARQVGMTTLLLLWSLWMIQTRPGFVVIWVSPHDKIAAEVLAKFRAIATACDVRLARDNAEHSEIEGGGRIVWASIGGSLATADVVGRAGTFHAAVLTEIAYPYEPDLVDVALDALMPALERHAAPVFLDSTPNGKTGPGRPYFELVRRIEGGDLRGAVWLCAWWLEPSYAEDAPLDVAMTAEEWALSDRAGGLTRAQIQWRRARTRTERDRRKFKEKYPESLSDCFLDADGSAILAPDVVERMLCRAWPKPIPEPLGRMHPQDPACAQHGRTWARCYAHPIRGARYYGGLDCASGRARDAQALVILDAAGALDFIARTYLEGQRLASLVCRACAHYGADLLIESQWSAHVTPYLRGGIALAMPGIPQAELDVLAARQRWRFQVEATSERSRTEIVGSALELAESVLVPDETLWGEFRGLTRDKKGRIAAGTGGFDDLVFAMGLAATLRTRQISRAARPNRGERRKVRDEGVVRVARRR